MDKEVQSIKTLRRKKEERKEGRTEEEEGIYGDHDDGKQKVSLIFLFFSPSSSARREMQMWKEMKAPSVFFLSLFFLSVFLSLPSFSFSLCMG